MMKKKYAFVVRVPQTGKRAYNHDRRISTLIEHQLKHLHEVEKGLPKRHQTNIDIDTLKTERQAADYIQKVTMKLHPQGAKTRRKRKPIGARKTAKKIKATKSKRAKPSKRKRK